LARKGGTFALGDLNYFPSDGGFKLIDSKEKKGTLPLLE